MLSSSLLKNLLGIVEEFRQERVEDVVDELHLLLVGSGSEDSDPF